MQTWPELIALTACAPLPPGVVVRQLGRSDIPAVIEHLRAWYPDLAHNDGGRHFCDAALYEREAALAGEPCAIAERPLYVMLIAAGERIVLIRIFKYDAATTIADMTVLAVDPEHRNRGLGRIAVEWSNALLRAAGATACECWVTLAHPYAQRGCETAGYRLAGILPGSDRESDADGERQVLVEALYVQVLAPDLVDWPEEESLRPAIAEVMRPMLRRG